MAAAMIARMSPRKVPPLTRLSRARQADGVLQRQIDAAIRSDVFAFAAQPVVDLRGGAIDDYELMWRMRTRERLLRPRDFVPEAEQTGQVRAIDLWTLGHGLELAREHRIALHIWRSAWKATSSSPSWTRACSASDSMRRA